MPPPTRLAQSSGLYRFRPRESLRLINLGSVAVSVTAIVNVQYDDGEESPFYTSATTTSDRTTAQSDFAVGLPKAGYVTSATVIDNTAAASATKRGQVYVGLHVIDASGIYQRLLCRGYLYFNHSVDLGENVEPGPGGGEGFVAEVAQPNPAAGAETTAAAVPTNALWRVHSFEISCPRESLKRLVQD